MVNDLIFPLCFHCALTIYYSGFCSLTVSLSALVYCVLFIALLEVVYCICMYSNGWPDQVKRLWGYLHKYCKIVTEMHRLQLKKYTETCTHENYMEQLHVHVHVGSVWAVLLPSGLQKQHSLGLHRDKTTDYA